MSSYISAMLYLYVLLCALLSVCNGLECWSNNCPEGEEWCSQTCLEDYVCLGSYSRDDVSLTPMFFSCVPPDNSNDCHNTRCDLTSTGPFNFFACCCVEDFCNVIDSIIPGVTGPPDGTVPTPAGPPPTTTTACEVYSHTEHVYKECTYCFAEYKFIEADQEYVLDRKECMDTEYASGCDDSCVLDTSGTSPLTSCCCEGYLCNEYRMLQFTDVRRVNMYVQPSPCDTSNCTHSCVVITNSTDHSSIHCFCRDGFLLTEAGTCVDIDECLMNPCEGTCINTEGSYMCKCPLGLRMHPNGTCFDDGLVCQNETGVSFCNDLVRSDGLEHPHCIALFRYVDGKFSPLHFNCFYDDMVCASSGSECVLDLDPRTLNDNAPLFFCCCSENFCNTNVTFPNIINGTIPTRATSSQTPPPSPSDTSEGIITIIAVGSVAGLVVTFIAVILVVVVCCACRSCKETSTLPSLPLYEQDVDTRELIPLNDHIDLEEKIGEGRFAEVHKGSHGHLQVAVKCFANRELMKRELNIFTLANFSHPNILKYHHFCDVPSEKKFWLVFGYHSKGSVYDVIVDRILHLPEFCTLAESAASGLAYLHNEVASNGTKKERVVHRDLKTKNILVKANGEACISDFGLSKTVSSIGQEHDAPSKVGTHRYMAPELLEGSIVFAQSSYRSIDCYALGIIFAEMLSRTKFNDEEPSAYSPPFSEFVPPQPTANDIRIVVTQGKRPPFPDRFIKSDAMDPLVNCVQELYDPVPDARSTAILARNKIKEFKVQYFGTESSEASTSSTPLPRAMPHAFNGTPSVSFSPSNYTTETTV